MKNKKIVEVNLGVGMNMFFPETIKIIIEDDIYEKRYKKYLKFCKTLEEPDFNYLVEDVNQNKVRELTFLEFVNMWDQNKNFQIKFNDEPFKKIGRKPNNTKKEIVIEKQL